MCKRSIFALLVVSLFLNASMSPSEVKGASPGVNDWPGLVSHWKFDEGSGATAYDSVGANHGAVYGATWIDGKIDGALSFDGVNDFVDLGKDSSLDFKNAFTISTWVKPRGQSGNYQRFFHRGYYNKDEDTKTLHIWYIYDTNEFGYRVRHDSNIKLVTGPAQRDVWQHFVATYDAGAMKLYINGAYVDGTTDADLQPEISDYNLFVGTAVGQVQKEKFFHGDLDDIMYFDRALSDEEILQLYQEGERPISHWKFDETTGTTAHDSVGPNHGAVHGAAWTNGKINGAL
ncbi:MAG: hypothetical protein AMJ79_09480, partial [Phycisphaerae bacterium SM23_30]